MMLLGIEAQRGETAVHESLISWIKVNHPTTRSRTESSVFRFVSMARNPA